MKELPCISSVEVLDLVSNDPKDLVGHLAMFHNFVAKTFIHRPKLGVATIV